MTTYYDIIDKIAELLQADVDVNTVTRGDIFEVDLEKITMYSLAHIMVNSITHDGRVLTVNISVIVMDMVDFNKDSTTDILKGNDNLDDVHNTTLAVITRLLEQLRRGDVQEDLYHLNGSAEIEPFKERFEGGQAGWVATFNVDMPNTMTIC